MGFIDRGYASGRSAYGSEWTAVAAILVATIAVFVANMLGPREPASINDLLALHGDLPWKPWRIWELVSYGFAHGMPRGQQLPWHILGNMLTLWFFGRAVEDVMGRAEFLRFYAAALVVAGLAWLADVALRPAGGELAVGGVDGVLRVIDAASGREVRTISSHGDWVTAVAWSEDGTRLASASRDKTVKVFDAASGELVATFSGHESPVRGVALAADGRQAWSAGDDGRMFRWNADDGRPVGKPVPLGGVGLRVVRDGDRVFVSHGGHAVAALSLADGRSTAFKLADWPLAVAVHAPSGRLATGSLDGEVRVFSLADGGFVKAWPARP